VGGPANVSRTFGLRKYIDSLRMVAMCGGDIQIHGHQDGPIWAIPIWPHTISVGAVMPQSGLRSRQRRGPVN
jgi:FADH2-dependent halogenase/halogenation protein CepH